MTFVVPPESTYNGRYLNVVDAGGLFLYDVDARTPEDCAFLAFNSGKVTRNGERASCSQSRNSLVTHTAVVKTLGQDPIEYGFNGVVSCRKMLQTEKPQVIRDCGPV